MNLLPRITRLEKNAAAAIVAGRPCTACGALAGWVSSQIVVDDDGRVLLPVCPTCMFPVMDDGRAITPLLPGSTMTRLRLPRIPPG